MARRSRPKGWSRSTRPASARSGRSTGSTSTVEEGTVLGLLGPNGAGKTTTVRILATLLRPDAGHATVAGFDVVREAQQLRTVIGLSGQYAAVDENLTGRENLWMFGRLYQLPTADARGRGPTSCSSSSTSTDAADRVVKTYSGGMRRRLDLAARADRPAAAAVPRRADDRARPAQPARACGTSSASLVREGTTLLLTTQYLEEADELADTIAVVDHGKIIARGTADELKSQVGGERIEVVVHDRARARRARREMLRAHRRRRCHASTSTRGG